MREAQMMAARPTTGESRRTVPRDDGWIELGAVVGVAAGEAGGAFGTIDRWNARAEQLFGYRAEEVIGKPISILVPPERLGELAEIVRRLREGEPVARFETVRRR